MEQAQDKTSAAGGQSDSTVGLACAVVAESSNTTPQYYYKENRCQSQTAHDADCVCWHDEGTGPFPDERPDDPDTLKEWRFKPANVQDNRASPASGEAPVDRRVGPLAEET